MKKLLLKIFAMMLLSMLLVYIILRIATLIIQFHNPIAPDTMYILSLVSGFCGLILFAFTLNLFVIRRLKRLSVGVNEVAKGNYDIIITDNGKDEIQDLATDFNRMTSELKSNEYLSRDFIRNVSHELKTPLSSIIGFSELISSDSLSHSETIEYAKIICHESKRLLGIGTQMLEISKLDATSKVEQNDFFRVDEQIRNIVLSLQNSWQNKNVDLQIDLPQIKINGNEKMTYHIWQNLISNAVNFVDDCGTISISLSNYDSEKLHFEISNTGKTIDECDKQLVFNQFYTGDKSKNTKSTGLGLSIVKKITDHLCGKVWFTSEHNLTTFFVELPHCSHLVQR